MRREEVYNDPEDIITFGKYKGRRLGECTRDRGYWKWVKSHVKWLTIEGEAKRWIDEGIYFRNTIGKVGVLKKKKKKRGTTELILIE